MPEIKQPEQLSLGLEDTRKGLFIDMEKLNCALEQLRINIRALDAIPIAGAPQPLGRPGQRVNRGAAFYPYEIIQLLRPAMIEINVGVPPENP